MKLNPLKCWFIFLQHNAYQYDFLEENEYIHMNLDGKGFRTLRSDKITRTYNRTQLVQTNIPTHEEAVKIMTELNIALKIMKS